MVCHQKQDKKLFSFFLVTKWLTKSVVSGKLIL